MPRYLSQRDADRSLRRRKGAKNDIGLQRVGVLHIPAPLVARGHRANFSTPRRVPVRALARLAGADVAQIVFSPTLPLLKGVPSAAHAMPSSAERATATESTLNDAGQPGLGPVLPAAPTSTPTSVDSFFYAVPTGTALADAADLASQYFPRDDSRGALLTGTPAEATANGREARAAPGAGHLAALMEQQTWAGEGCMRRRLPSHDTHLSPSYRLP